MSRQINPYDLEAMAVKNIVKRTHTEIDYRKLEKRVAKLEEQNRWRKFPEESPEGEHEGETEEFLGVFTIDEIDGIWRDTVTYNYDNDEWLKDTGVGQVLKANVTHWRPLPELPRE